MNTTIVQDRALSGAKRVRQHPNYRAIGLAEAVRMGPQECGAYLSWMFDFKPEEVEQAVETWLFLFNAPASSKKGERLRKEVQGLHVLLIALMSPAAEFMRWFKLERENWHEFEGYGAIDQASEAQWGANVLRRARKVCAGFDDVEVRSLPLHAMR